MPNGFDVIDGAELLSGWIQGGTVPASHESQTRFLLMDPAAIAKLRALVMAAQNGTIPLPLRAHAQDILDALDAPAEAAWRAALDGP